MDRARLDETKDLGSRQEIELAGSLRCDFGPEELSDVDRYRARLQTQSARSSSSQSFQSANRGYALAGGQPLQFAEQAEQAGQTIAAAPTATTHLASLDVQLPARGAQFLFTTPRGDIEITARAVESSHLNRLAQLGGAAILAVALLIGSRLLRKLRRNRG